MERGREIAEYRPSDIHPSWRSIRQRPANCRARGHVLPRSTPLRVLLSGPIQRTRISSWQPVPVTRIRVQLVRSCAKTPSNHREWGDLVIVARLWQFRVGSGRPVAYRWTINNGLSPLASRFPMIYRLGGPGCSPALRERNRLKHRAMLIRVHWLLIDLVEIGLLILTFYGMRSLIPRLIWSWNRSLLAFLASIRDHRWSADADTSFTLEFLTSFLIEWYYACTHTRRYLKVKILNDKDSG